MDYLEAIDNRRSRRTYTGKPIEKEIMKRFQVLADNYNWEADLNIQIIEDGSDAFNGITKSYGLFKGVKTLIALVGERDDENLKEKLGYYGELMVLEATKLGLGTCWVGGSFDRESCIVPLAKNESLECVITVGYVPKETLKERLIHNLVARKSKPLEAFYRSDAELPQWIVEGLKAVQKAPSAVNKQPVIFEYKEKILTAFVESENRFELIDLGIAKAHFVLATGCKAEWGNKPLIP